MPISWLALALLIHRSRRAVDAPQLSTTFRPSARHAPARVDQRGERANLEYIGIATVPFAWLAFALQYTGREGRLTGRNLALLSALPLVTLLLAWTNEAHGLIWSSTRLSEGGPFPALEVDHGAWFWVHWSYSYLLLLVGTILLVSMLTRSPNLYRKQNLALLVAVSVPWVGNGVYVLGLSLVPNLDLTPFESL